MNLGSAVFYSHDLEKLFRSDGVEKLYDELRPKVNLYQELNEYSWGKELSILDPDGNKKLLEEALELIKRDLAGVKDVQENQILPSVTETELTLKSYAESYKINQLNVGWIDTRLSTVEGKYDIKRPEDLMVPHFASE